MPRTSRGLALALALFTALAGAPARGAIEAPPDAKLTRDFRPVTLEFFKVTLHDPYAANAAGQPWAEAGRLAVEALADRLNGDRTTKTITRLREAAEKAVNEMGCDDPAVLFAHGLALDAANRPDSAGVLQAALDGLVAKGYGALNAGCASGLLGERVRKNAGADAAAPYFEDAAAFYLRAFREREPVIRPEFARPVMRLLDLSFQVAPGAVSVPLTEEIAGIEGVDPWLASALQGTARIRLAWDIRSTRLARHVTQEQFEAFYSELRVAEQHLKRAHEIDPTRPQPAAFMITVKMGLGQYDEMRGWFDKAVAAQLDYRGAYTGLLWALRPRWGGSLEEMFKFGLECRETARYDSDVPWYFLQALIDIAYEDESFEFWNEANVYGEAADTFRRLIHAPEHAEFADYRRSLWLGFAVRCGQFVEAKKLMDELGDRLDDDALAQLKLTRREAVRLIEAGACTERLMVSRGDSALEWGMYDEAAEAYSEALPKLENQPTARAVVVSRLYVAEMSRRLEQGDWTSLPFDADHSGFKPLEGEWSVNDQGELIGRPDKNGRAVIACEGPVGPRFEIEAVIDCSRLARDNFGLLGVLTSLDEGFERTEFHAVALHKRDKFVYLSPIFFRGKRIDADVVDGANVLKVAAWDGHLAVEVNGKPVYAGPAPEIRDREPGYGFGFGGHGMSPGANVVVQRAKLRLLAEPPLALREFFPGDTPRRRF